MQYSYTISIVNWQDETSALRFIRTIVFIQEQKVPEDLEWDAFDLINLHVLALSADGQPIGTARLLPDGYIGRMAVVKEWRCKGVGSAMLVRILKELVNRGMQSAILNAQISAINFYKKFGFEVTGEEFMEAGIRHVKMTLQL